MFGQTPPMDIPFWSAADADRHLSSPTADLDIGAGRGTPVVIVDDAHLLGGPATDALSRLPVVSVGVTTEPAPGFDTVTPSAATANAMAATVTEHPQAALSLCQVLRRGPVADTASGLLLESAAYGTLQAGPEHRRWLDARGRRTRPDDPTPPVLVAAGADGVRLTLNRPRLHNLWTAAMRDALVDALRGLAVDGDDRPILIDATGPSFCAGGDPAEFGTVPDPATGHVIRSTANAAPWLDRLAHRLTVRVHGAAIGAGVELAAFAHRVEATADARFGLPEVSMGLIPGAGGTVSVPRRIGRQRTVGWCLSGEVVDAATAVSWGLVDALVDQTDGD